MLLSIFVVFYLQFRLLLVLLLSKGTVKCFLISWTLKINNKLNKNLIFRISEELRYFICFVHLSKQNPLNLCIYWVIFFRISKTSLNSFEINCLDFSDISRMQARVFHYEHITFDFEERIAVVLTNVCEHLIWF